jgi:hypothetical protein
MIQMAKKRKPGAGRKKGAMPPRVIVASLKASEEYRDWFEGLIEHCRSTSGWPDLPAATIIERGLRCFAKEQGYEPEPPRR